VPVHLPSFLGPGTTHTGTTLNGTVLDASGVPQLFSRPPIGPDGDVPAGGAPCSSLHQIFRLGNPGFLWQASLLLLTTMHPTAETDQKGRFDRSHEQWRRGGST